MIKELYKVYLDSDGVSTDTRDNLENKVFFALKGENFNANSFAKEAINKGARAVVIDEFQDDVPNRFLVDNVLKTLQELAKFHREKLGIPILAITGSNGKTTTKELIWKTLSTHCNITATKGNLNNHIGIPLTLLSIPLNTDFAIVEMGANHIGEIASYCQYCLPNYGLITNIGKAHLEGFGSLEGVKKAKGELYDYIRSVKGLVYYCKDLEYLEQMSQGIKRKSYGNNSSADIVGKIIEGSEYLELECNGKTFKTQLTGNYNFPNVMAAICIGLDQGMSMTDIQKNIEEYKPDNSRSQVIKLGDGTQIIMDAYNANPSSMKLALENLSSWPNDNKVACIGAMKELGADSQKEHQAIVDLAKELGIQQVLLVGPEFDGCERYGMPYFNESEKAGDYLKENMPPKGSTILIKGSRGSKMENIYKAIGS